MADVLQEFLIKIGYQIDQSQQNRFAEGLKSTHAQMQQLQLTLANSVRQFEQLATSAGGTALERDQTLIDRFRSSMLKSSLGHELSPGLGLGRAKKVPASLARPIESSGGGKHSDSERCCLARFHHVRSSLTALTLEPCNNGID